MLVIAFLYHAHGPRKRRVFRVKRLLQIQGEKLDALCMTHGLKAARLRMLDALERDLETRFKDDANVTVEAAYTCSDEEAESWAGEIRARFGSLFDEYIAPLSLSIACHTGPGAYGVGCVRKINR